MSQCIATVWTKVSRGIMGKGTESFTEKIGQCQNRAKDGEEYCGVHKNANDRLAVKLERKRRYEAARKAEKEAAASDPFEGLV